MQVVGIDAFLVPSGDPHLSEYVHPHYERRSFISGFTGSAGVALVTQDSAMLWTDGRYFLQAEAELGPEWKLMRSNQGGVPPLEGWLATALAENSVVGIDPMVHSSEDAEKLTASLSAASRPPDLHTRPPHVIHPSTTRPPPVLQPALSYSLASPPACCPPAMPPNPTAVQRPLSQVRQYAQFGGPSLECARWSAPLLAHWKGKRDR